MIASLAKPKLILALVILLPLILLQAACAGSEVSQDEDSPSPAPSTPAATTFTPTVATSTPEPSITQFAVIDYEIDPVIEGYQVRSGWRAVQVTLRIENSSGTLDGFPQRPEGRYAAFLDVPEGFSYVYSLRNGGGAIPLGLSVNLQLLFEIPQGLPDSSLTASRLVVHSLDFQLSSRSQVDGIRTADLLVLLGRKIYSAQVVADLELLEANPLPSPATSALPLGDGYRVADRGEFVVSDLTLDEESATLLFTFTNLSGRDVNTEYLVRNLSLVDGQGYAHSSTGSTRPCGEDLYSVAPFETIDCLDTFPVSIGGLSGAHIVGEFFDSDHVAVWRIE